MKAETSTADSEPVNVSKKGKFYHYELMVEGQRERRSTKCTDRDKAIAKARKRKKEMLEEAARLREQDVAVDAKFDQAADKCWHAIKAKLRTTGERPSRAARRREFKRVVLLFGPATMCSAMTVDRFVEVRDWLLEEPAPENKRGRPRKGEGLTPKSINNLLLVAMRILNYAADNMKLHLPDRPLPPLDLLLDETPRARYLREGPEQVRLLEHCGQDLADVIEFALETGLRWNELAGLTWNDVDPLEESIRAYVKGKGHDPISHTVFLSEQALLILDRRRERAAESEFVFTTTAESNYAHGELDVEKGAQVPWTYNRMHRQFSAALEESDIADFGFHDLRRTAARRLWWDSNLEIAQAFLGHKDPKTTLKYLGITKADEKAAQHVRAKKQKERRDLVEAAIKKGLPTPEVIDDKRVQRIRAQFVLEKRLAERRKAA